MNFKKTAEASFKENSCYALNGVNESSVQTVQPEVHWYFVLAAVDRKPFCLIAQYLNQRLQYGWHYASIMFFVLRINVCSHILQGDNSFKILCQLFTKYNSDFVYPWPSVFFLHWKSHCVSKVLFFVLTVIGFHFLGIETWKTYYEEFFFKKGVAFRKGMELWWDMAY